MNRSALVLLALILGLATGMAVGEWGSLRVYEVTSQILPLGTMWTNAIRMTVVPLVVALVVTGVAGGGDLSRIGAHGRKLIPIFVVLLLTGGILAVAIGIPAMERLDISPVAASNLRAVAVESGSTTPSLPSLTQRLVEIVPVNPIKAAVDAAMLPLVFFALCFALALLRIPGNARAPAVNLFRAVADTMLVLVGWVLLVAPIGIFALAFGLGLQMGTAAAGALLYYVVVLSGVLILFTLLLYPTVRLVAGTSMRVFTRAAAQAQGIALSSRSSLAALPAVIAGARTHLHSPESVTGFAIPLAVSVFRVNVPMAWVIGVLFLGHLYGVDVGVGDLVLLVALSSFISFSVPGIPSASLFLMAPVLVNMGIPAEGAAILISVDAIPAMFKTAANVTSHAAVAAVLSEPETEPAAPVAEVPGKEAGEEKG